MTTKSNNSLVGIKAAALAVNRDEHYIRVLVQSGKIASVKQPINDTQFKHLLDIEEVKKYFEAVRSTTNREDGFNHFDLYCTLEQAQKLADAGMKVYKHKTHQRDAVLLVPTVVAETK